MDDHETVRPGWLETLRRLAATILAIFQNRLELLVVELQEERVHLLNALLLTAAIVALGWFTLAMAACALSIVVWNGFGVKGLWAFSGLGATERQIWQRKTTQRTERPGRGTGERRRFPSPRPRR